MTTASGPTWGERIEFTLTPVDAARTVVRIESRSRLRTTLVDYGQNFENVEKLRTLLDPARAA